MLGKMRTDRGSRIAVSTELEESFGLPRAAIRDLEKMFEYYCTHGTGRAMGMTTTGVIMMDSRNLARCCRQTGLLGPGSRLSTARVDLIFTDVCSAALRQAGLDGQKEGKEVRIVPKKIDFIQFLQVINRFSSVLKHPLMRIVEQMANSSGGADVAQVRIMELICSSAPGNLL